MTLQRDTETGTANFRPGQGITGDVFSLARPPVQAPNQENLAAARFSVTPVGGKYKNLYHWIAEIYDPRGAITQEGRFDFTHASVKELQGGDSRFRNTLSNALLTYSTSTPAQNTTGAWTMFQTVFGGQPVWSLENSTDVQLVTETSATNSAPVGIVYSHPGRLVSGLNVIAMNGVDYVAVQYNAQATELLSDLTVAGPTVAGSMNAGTVQTFGIQQTELPDRPMVMHIGSTLATLASNVAIGTAPTVVRSSLPVGGYLAGIQGLGGGTPYIYWNWPRQFSGGGYVPYVGSSINGALNPTYIGKVVRCDMFGLTVSDLDTPFANVVHTWIVRDGIVAGDLDRLWFTNGRRRVDMKVFKDEPVDSDRVRKITGGWVSNKQELVIEINECDVNLANGTTRWQRKYDFDLDTWSDISARTTESASLTGGIRSVIGAGVLPTSPQTGYLHSGFDENDFVWLRKWEPPPGANPWAYRKTSGAGASTGKEYEDTVTADFTSFDIPGLEGYPKTVTRVIGPPMSHIEAGGSNAYMTVEVAGKTSKFSAGQRSARYPIDNRGFTGNWVSQISVTATGHQQTGGTDPTRYALNLLPITIEGYCLKDDDTPPGDWRAIKR